MPDFRKGDGSQLRPELTLMPSRMNGLPVVRGYPVPWFVDWIDGVPEFRAMDHVKLVTATTNCVCWVCGEPTGRNVSFVSGPMCGINRISAEPPNHRECAVWSAVNCPFLNNPEFERRETPMPGDLPRIPAAGVMILRNPGVTMVWTTRDYTVIPVRQKGAQSGYLFQLGDPVGVEWFHRGRKAKRAEVERSIETGLPALVSQCGGRESDHAMLELMRKDFIQYLPRE